MTSFGSAVNERPPWPTSFPGHLQGKSHGNEVTPWPFKLEEDFEWVSRSTISWKSLLSQKARPHENWIAFQELPGENFCLVCEDNIDSTTC